MDQSYLTLLLSFCFGVLLNQQQLLVGSISTEKFLALTLREKTSLDKFRTKVQPILTQDDMKQDTYLIRWLRSRDFNLESAETMLRENLRWRRENKVDKIRLENWRDILADFPLTTDTYDRIGQPIGVIDMNLWDLRRVILQGKGQRFIRFLTNLAENLTDQVVDRQKKGMNVTQIVVLLNADGFNVVQHACPMCLPYWIQFIQIFENYYPEWLDEFIVIEATPAVQIVLSAIRPVLSRNTREAIKVFGPNKRKWMDYLEKKISKEERRKTHGGTKPPLQY